jgi:hypothetical protein
VVANCGKPNPGGDAQRPPQGAQEGSLADAIAPTAGQDIAGPIVFGEIERIIGIVTDPVPDGVINPDRLFHRIPCFTGHFPGIFHNPKVVAIDDGSGVEVCRVHWGIVVVHSVPVMN